MNNNLKEINSLELSTINGGGWKEAGQAFVGTIKIGTAPIVAATGHPIKAVKNVVTGWNQIKTASENV